MNAKKEQIKGQFSDCKTSEELYHRIIQLGKSLPKLLSDYKTDAYLVHGCQSIVYLRSFMNEGKIFFEADSDGLISKGLAALLIHFYSGESPEHVLTTPPDFIEELGLESALTPNRANGLHSIHLRMKQEGLKALVSSN